MAEDETEPRGPRTPTPQETIGATTHFDLATLRAHKPRLAHPIPSLTVVDGAQAGLTVVLADLPTDFGRDLACSVVLTGRGISRRHFRVEAGENTGQLEIVDLDSTNGVYVNQVRIRRRSLASGDRIQIGPSTALRFAIEDVSDVAVRQRKYEESIRDDLTGAFNRRFFDRILEQEIAFARRHREALAVLLIDLDHFKRVNDEFGHPAGDEVLRRVADRLASQLRAEDFLARYGGEEFAVLLRGQDRGGAWETAERLRCDLDIHPVKLAHEALRVTVSVGIAALENGAPDLGTDLMQTADQNLYAAKAAGRNRTAGAEVVGGD